MGCRTGSARTCRVRLRVPAEVSGAFARYRIQRAWRIARALERLERFAAHRGIDVQVRHAADRPELLQHEEDDAVVHQAAPVAPADQVALFLGQPGGGETPLRIADECVA